MASVSRVLQISVGVFLVLFVLHLEQCNARVIVAPSVVNCTIYNSSQPCLPGDRNLFCLTNGTTVRGICEAQVAVCLEGANISSTLDPCLQTPGGQLTTTPDPNTGVMCDKSFTANAIFFVTSLLFARIVWTIELGY